MNSRFQMPIEGFLRRTFKPRGINRIDGCVLATSLGRVRSENQDRMVHLTGLSGALKGASLTVVADGMGGMTNGGLAAEIGCAAFVASFLDRDVLSVEQRLRNAAMEADAAVFRQLRGKGGTTLTAAVVTKGVAFVVSVGDSRLYSYAREDGLRQVTDDDTLGELLKRSRPESAPVDRASQLVQFVGLGEGVEPHLYVADATEGSMIMIMTDGAHSIGNALIEKLCNVNETHLRVAEAVLSTSTALGGFDNASIAVLQSDPDHNLATPNGPFVSCFIAVAGVELCMTLPDAGRGGLRVAESAEHQLAAPTDGLVESVEREESAEAPKPKKRRAKRASKASKKKVASGKADALSLVFPGEKS